jgi:hypothetical protein
MEEKTEESFILIRFPGADSASPEIFFNNVNAFQVMATAAALEVHGKNGFVQAINARADQEERVAVAKPEILLPR